MITLSTLPTLPLFVWTKILLPIDCYTHNKIKRRMTPAILQ